MRTILSKDRQHRWLSEGRLCDGPFSGFTHVTTKDINGNLDSEILVGGLVVTACAGGNHFNISLGEFICEIAFRYEVLALARRNCAGRGEVKTSKVLPGLDYKPGSKASFRKGTTVAEMFKVVNLVGFSVFRAGGYAHKDGRLVADVYAFCPLLDSDRASLDS